MGSPENVRNTDEDWIKIGSDDPYWGVFSSERFRKGNISADDIQALYETGRREIDQLAGRVTRFFDGWPRPQRALDFGCGVGRHAIAMQAWADKVAGVDVSPGMLEIARRRAGTGSRAEFVAGIPEQVFDWINSYIVFQHIPPERGLAILDTLLEKLAPRGVVTLHFTLHREDHLRPKLPRTRTGIVMNLRKALGAGRAPAIARVGDIQMYDYPLGEIVRRYVAHGMGDLLLIQTSSGGHHGACIIGRREAPAASPS